MPIYFVVFYTLQASTIKRASKKLDFFFLKLTGMKSQVITEVNAIIDI